MSQLMYTVKGAVRLPDDSFAKGGEGAVYSVERNPGIVAKVYHPQYRTAQREQKILTMLARPPKAGSSVAWPLEAIYTDRFCRNFAGFLMPRVQNSIKINDLYDPDKRDRHSWAFYIRVAQNLCAALDAVHRSGHVCGDLNPANICVDEKTGLVMLVDTDSFHVHQPGGTVFPCQVCRPEYVPAEIQKLVAGGRSLRDIRGTTFTVWTDRFALACHIFSLLMNGCHPFACSVQSGCSAGQFSLHQNITDGRFAFTAKDPRISIPVYAPKMDALTDRLREFCERAFCANQYRPDQRPSPDEWYSALEELEKDLTTCSKKHQYRAGAGKCPFCAVEKRIRKLTPQKTPSAPVKLTFPASGGAAAIRRPLTARAAIAQTLGFLAAFCFWGLFEYEMLHVMYQLITVWNMGLAAYFVYALIPWIPFWILKLWGPGQTPWWQGIRAVCRCSVVLTVALSFLLGYLDVTADGGSLFFISLLYCLPPCAFAAIFPGASYRAI